MNRRTFLKASAMAAAAATGGPWRGAAAAPTERIALGTLTFRQHFRFTADPDVPVSMMLRLQDVPEYFADKFGVHAVEFWAMHFEGMSPAYLRDVRGCLEAAQSTLVNVQIASDCHMAAEDEDLRQEGLETARQWIDISAALGAKAARINTGDGSVAQCTRSFREMNAYAKDKGLILLAENHGGLSADPDMLVQLCADVDDDNMQIVPDFGNFGDLDPLEGLRKLMPCTRHLISAKTAGFDENGGHTAFDFGACVRLCEELGFPGIYSGEYFGPMPIDADKVAQWMVDAVRENLRSA